MEKAYKYRIYPNKKQKEIIAKTFGCCRFVYNTYLAKRIEMYENEKTTERIAKNWAVHSVIRDLEFIERYLCELN